MSTTCTVWLTSVSLLLAAGSGCGDAEPAPPSRAIAAAATTDPTIAAGEPILQLWKDAIYLLDSKPSLMFALWADGTTVHHVNGRMYRGQLRPSELEALQQTFRNAGLFDVPADVLWVGPDAGSWTIVARDGDRRVRLTYDSGYDGADVLNQIDPTASPSPAEVNAFLRRWHGTINAIHAVTPERLERIKGDIRLGYPVTRPH
jgi:hypothetical protein